MDSPTHSSKSNIIAESSFSLDQDPNQKKLRFKWPSYTKLLVQLGLFSLFTAYFLWASYYYFKNSLDSSFNSTTCNGYGFLVILYTIIFFSFLYYKLFKPSAAPLLNRSVYKPFTEWFHSNSKIAHWTYIIFCVAFFGGLLIYLGFDTDDNRHRLIPLAGLAIFIAIGWLLSNNKKKIAWRTVLWGLKLQFIFGLLTIRWDVGRNTFKCIGDKVNAFLDYAKEGSKFVYGEDLVIKLAVFAFSSITAIYFLAFIINILYYYGVMQKLVSVIGEFLQFVMDTTICESVNCAANIFLGLSEAPLLIKPYLKNLTDSELHSIMTSGFATVAGSVLAAYIDFGADPAALITASVMSAPAALCYSKLIYPETEEILVTKENVSEVENEYESVLDAATQAINTAFQMVTGICGSLIAFISFVAMINGILSWFGFLVGYSGSEAWTLDIILGKIFTPVSFIMGVPWDESELVGTLIGKKTIINEFLAYEEMGKMKLTARSKLIATYAICGFANPGSIGIMISGLSSIVPHKKNAIIKVIPRSFIGGVLVCFMTACIAGMLVPESAL